MSVLDDLRSQVLAISGTEEKVEVNQRHLIDKILARYSAEFTVFRELLQNANDADALEVEIIFQDVKQGGLFGKDKCRTIIVRNNGRPFRQEDWLRLRKIAEGNPDEQKIGFFGVGFYSLFSMCEEPFVTSGSECMAFYWRGDQLFAKRAPVPKSQQDRDVDETGRPWTTFLMNLREPMDIPDRDEFSKFLASSLAFTKKLSRVSMVRESKVISEVRKALGPSRLVDVGRTKGLVSKTPEGFFNLQVVELRDVELTVAYGRTLGITGKRIGEGVSEIKGSEDTSLSTGHESGMGSLTSDKSSSASEAMEDIPLGGPNHAEPIKPLEQLTVRMATGTFNVKIPKHQASEMERTTKKQPPRQTMVSLLYPTWKQGDNVQDDTGSNGFKDTSALVEGGGPVREGLRGVVSSLLGGVRGNSILSALSPYPSSGRIYIGFPTHQTTGFSSHVAGSFIPTVERESIDLVDPSLRAWNIELLTAAGILSRLLYEMEMREIGQIHEAHAPAPGSFQLAKNVREGLEARAAKALCAFTFSHPSTPNALIGRRMAETFESSLSSSLALPLYSTRGVHRADEVFVADSEIRSFLHGLPMLPHPWQEGQLTDKLIQDGGLVKRFSLPTAGVNQILDEVRSRPFTEEECVALLKWWFGSRRRRKEQAGYREAQGNTSSSFPSWGYWERSGRRVADEANPSEALVQALVVHLNPEPGTDEDKVVALSKIEHFTIAAHIPPHLPVPPSTLPPSISRHFSGADLGRLTNRWSELPILDWLLHVSGRITELDRGSDKSSAISLSRDMLGVVGRRWAGWGEMRKHEVKAILQGSVCMPAERKSASKKQGKDIPAGESSSTHASHTIRLYLPGETYIRKMPLFPDLPVASPGRGILETLLVELGVRQHLELQMIFDQQHALSWDHVQLLRFLSSLTSTLTQQEIARLCQTPFFPRLNGPPEDLYMANKLYVPDEHDTSAGGIGSGPPLSTLGLPQLKWPSHPRWRPNSDEATFAVKVLGLQEHPTLDTLIELMADKGSEKRRDMALNYFSTHFSSVYSRTYRPDRIKRPFIPCEGDTKLSLPSECFLSPSAKILEFSVVEASWRGHAREWGVREHPQGSELVNRLLTQVPSLSDSSKVADIFEYLSTATQELKSRDWDRLRSAAFIPVKRSGGNDVIEWVRPAECYFARQSTQGQASVIEGERGVMEALFLFIDFGTKANVFLRACGVRDEPSPLDIARMMAKDPIKVLESAGGKEEVYLGLLRILAVNEAQIFRDSSLRLALSKSRCLLAYRRKRSSESQDHTALGKEEEEEVMEAEDEEGETEWELGVAKDISLMDDIVLNQLFTPLYAPMEPYLEGFYEKLGSTWLSAHVQVAYELTPGDRRETSMSRELEKRIKERMPLLLPETSSRFSSSSSISRGGGGRNLLTTKEIRSTAEKSIRDLRVIEVPRIGIRRTMVPTGEIKVQATSACSSGSSPPIIYVARSEELDFFDVAQALGKMVLRTCRLNDALLLSTLLSSTLPHLRRKGFPVDKLLRAAQAKKAASLTPKPQTEVPKASEEEKMSREMMEDCISRLLHHYPSISPGRMRQLVQAWSEKTGGNLEQMMSGIIGELSGASSGEKGPSAPSSTSDKDLGEAKPLLPPKSTPKESKGENESGGMLKSMFNRWSRSFTPAEEKKNPGSSPPQTPPPAKAAATETLDPHATERLNRSLSGAIKACKAHDENHLQSVAQATPVRESMVSHCDSSVGMRLRRLHIPGSSGKEDGMALFVDEDVKDSMVLGDTKLLREYWRFSALLLRLGKEVFDLDAKAIHMFYDLVGPTIAFHRSGTSALFFNLRYFISLHAHPPSPDQGEESGSSQYQATIYWYLTFCHELAHHFVQPHNSQHEFYLSAFAERYMRKVHTMLGM